MLKKEFKKLEEVLVQVGLRIAKRGEGALFVVGEVKFKPLVDQTVPSFRVVDNPKLLESLALMDGAVIINREGYLKAYGVMIESKKTFKNFGTRHSAGYNASMIKGNVVFVVSEEDKKIRILRDGKMIMQIDALQKGVEKSIPYSIQALESIGAGTVGALGAGILAPSLGVALVPGVILFGSAYYLIKYLTNKFKQ